MGPWRRSARFAALALVLSAAANLAACGARTELYGREPCGQAGSSRVCQNNCGPGTQVCVEGYWGDCLVETTQRSCRNDCGEGTQVCVDDQWQACEVAITQRTCSNECGSGTQQCEAGIWADCEVPIATRGCEDVCGSGVQDCVDGAWALCQVAPTTQSCSNECGSGISTCEQAVWSVCDVPIATHYCMSVCGSGQETCQDGAWQPCNAPQPKPPKLKATIRDFDDTHPDFEIDLYRAGSDYGIVQPDLGPDDKPVYAQTTTLTTSGVVNFDQWYRDTPGVNLSMPLDLQLTAESGVPVFFEYTDTSFFPIDDQLLGNQSREHNYHFTLEAETTFTYVGGEEFTFSGDDDMWVFVNRHLAIDLGGLHSSLTDTINLDQSAAELGIELGGTYSIHFFFAERHTVESNFTIRTTVAEAGSCD